MLCGNYITYPFKVDVFHRKKKLQMRCLVLFVTPKETGTENITLVVVSPKGTSGIKAVNLVTDISNKKQHNVTIK